MKSKMRKNHQEFIDKGMSHAEDDKTVKNQKVLRYQNPSPLSRDEALRIFATGTESEICDALVAIACYGEDWKWSQDQCLNLLNHSDQNIRGLAAGCLGHIARVHQQLDRELVVNSLNKLLNDEKKLASLAQINIARIEDAFGDIRMFLQDN